jgi:hypothetical protein
VIGGEGISNCVSFSSFFFSGTVCIDPDTICQAVELEGKNNAFEIMHRPKEGSSSTSKLKSRFVKFHHEMSLQAPNEADRQIWIECINKVAQILNAQRELDMGVGVNKGTREHELLLSGDEGDGGNGCNEGGGTGGTGGTGGAGGDSSDEYDVSNGGNGGEVGLGTHNSRSGGSDGNNTGRNVSPLPSRASTLESVREGEEPEQHLGEGEQKERKTGTIGEEKTNATNNMDEPTSTALLPLSLLPTSTDTTTVEHSKKNAHRRLESSMKDHKLVGLESKELECLNNITISKAAVESSQYSMNKDLEHYCRQIRGILSK